MLNILGLFLLWLLYIPNGIVQIYIARKKRSTLYHTAKMQFNDAYAIDVFAAEIYREFWNTTIVKIGGVYFTPYIKNTTISWYLAANKENKTLTFFGKVLYYAILIADFTTWFSGGHYKFYNE